MRIDGYMLDKRGDARPLARHLAEKCKAFYEDEENERSFQEWKRELAQYKDTAEESAFLQWWKAQKNKEESKCLLS